MELLSEKPWRKARDSNPQPPEEQLISSQHASHSLTFQRFHCSASCFRPPAKKGRPIEQGALHTLEEALRFFKL